MEAQWATLATAISPVYVVAMQTKNQRTKVAVVRSSIRSIERGSRRAIAQRKPNRP